ncbi:MAG: 3-keto-disaccharide hydrolase [bacterium]
MINKYFTKKLVLIGIFALFAGISYGQDNNKTPESTEIWEPQPKKVEPGSGNQPPSDAIVLFDGSDLSEWEHPDGSAAEWNVHDSMMTVEPGTGMIFTKREFGDMHLHIEFKCPEDEEGEGQGKGNSGVFLQGRYEVQVLDSYENKTYANGQAGSIYKQHIPMVNASRKPGEWQSYDIIYQAPRFNDEGKVIIPAKMTVLHNGVLIHNHVTLQGSTKFVGAPKYEEHELKQPLGLQDHSNLVSYRNIWVREL